MGIMDYIGGGIGSGQAGAGNMIDSFLHPEKGYEAAADEEKKAWLESKGFLQPYQQNGLNQTGALNTAENNLMHPETLENQWVSGYQESPYAKNLRAESNAAGMDSASQQGLMGSSAALNNIQTSSSNIVNADRNNYLQDLMNKYLQGIGMAQNTYGIGANAGGAMATGRLQNGQNLAEAQLGATNAPGELLSKGIGTAVGAMSGTGGGFAGTPAYGRPIRAGGF